MVNSPAFNTAQLHWSMPIASWAAWDANQAEQTDANADLLFVEPMQRRRLSPLARAAFHVAHRCSGARSNIAMVYASRHGELQRTVALFQSIAAREALSPTMFGLSVLNANVGLYSIARQDTAPATAVSAGNETFGFGLLEAWSRASSTNSPVLYVYADAPVPSPFSPLIDDSSNVLAIAMLIDPDAGKKLHCIATTTAPDHLENTQAQATAFLPTLRLGHRTQWSGNHRQWEWKWDQ